MKVRGMVQRVGMWKRLTASILEDGITTSIWTSYKMEAEAEAEAVEAALKSTASTSLNLFV